MPQTFRKMAVIMGAALLGVIVLALGSPSVPRNSSPPRGASIAELHAAADLLRPLHRGLGRPRPGDWLESHEESGQTFAEYRSGDPATPTGRRRTLYVQPLGDLRPTERRIIERSAEFMGLYFNLPVTVLEALPLSVIPKRARRIHPTWGGRQILSTYVLDDLLRPRLPADGAAIIAFTNADLWPGRGWNFVFGQASLRDRTGVWSIHRNGDPDASPEAFRLCLLRTMKTATHETGHMFSLRHCTAYECNMCGSNNRQESDRHPLALCPECLAKVCWATRTEPLARYERLAVWCRSRKLPKQAARYDELAACLRAR